MRHAPGGQHAALPAPPRDTRGPTLPPQPRSVGPTDHAAHALLVAKQVLLRAALDLLTGELAAGTSLPMPPIMISEEHAREAAQLLLRSPAMEGAASMLAWSATTD